MDVEGCTKHKRRILILFGGNSSEYEISCLSAAGIAQNIDQNKYESLMIGITRDNKWMLTNASIEEIKTGEWIKNKNNIDVTLSLNRKYPGIFMIDNEQCKLARIDCIFPILHGQTGEDGSIQGALQLSGVPYVGCNVQSSVIGFDKVFTKMIASAIGVPQAKSYIIYRKKNASKKIDDICKFFQDQYPLFVKPAREGSSVGISKISNRDNLEGAINTAFQYDNKIVIEEGIMGREIEVAVLGKENPVASPIGEIIADDEFYSYDAKYKSQKSHTAIVSDIEDELAEKIKLIALKIYKALECESLARVDFFLKKNNEIVFNEINTMPGFTPISMYPKLWEAYGIEYSELISRLIDCAINR